MRTTITTDRLVLRPYELKDAQRISKLAGDPCVARMTGTIPSPYPALAVEGWILLQAGLHRRGSDYGYALTRAEDGALMGGVGLHRRGGRWIIGYWVGKPFHGQGYAAEAARGLIAAARQDLGVDALTADWFEDNPASGHILETLGFKPTGEVYPSFSLARGEAARAVGMEWRASPQA